MCKYAELVALSLTPESKAAGETQVRTEPTVGGWDCHSPAGGSGCGPISGFLPAKPEMTKTQQEGWDTGQEHAHPASSCQVALIWPSE